MGKLILLQMLREPGKTTGLCVSIACALAVVLLLEGFQEGLLQQLRQVVLERGADLIVTQAGVTNFLASRSKLRQLSRRDVEAVAGVGEAYPLTLLPVVYEKRSRKTPLILVVYDSAGGPGDLTMGAGITGPKQIVIDASLAALHRLSVGSEMSISGYRFTVSGIARHAAAMFTPLAFITYDDLIDLYFESDLVGDISTLPLLSFLLVAIENGRDANVLAAEISAAVPDVDVFLPTELAQNEVALGKTLFGPVMDVLIGISYGLCLMVVSIIMLAVVSSRLRSFGVMKAMGFSTKSLMCWSLLEAGILTGLALPLALVGALLAGWVIEIDQPLYLVSVAKPEIVLRTLLAAVVVSMVAATLPLSLIARADPATVFRD